MNANAWGFVGVAGVLFNLWVALVAPASLQFLQPYALPGMGLCLLISAVLFLWAPIRRPWKGKDMSKEEWMPIDEAQEWLRGLFRQHGVTDEKKLVSAPMDTIQMAIEVGRLNFKGPSNSELTHVNRGQLLHDYPDKEHSMLYDSFTGTRLYPTAGTPQAVQMFSTKKTLFKDSTIVGGVRMDKTDDTTFDGTDIRK